MINQTSSTEKHFLLKRLLTEKYLQNLTKDLHKELNRKANNLVKKWAKDLNRNFIKEELDGTKVLKRYSTL